MNGGILHHSLKKGWLMCNIVRNYAIKDSNPAILGLGKKSKKGTIGTGSKSNKKEMQVETDTHKLVQYVCGSNIFQEGEDVKIKPDSEYPDWLWSVHTGPPKTVYDVEFGTKEYYELLKELNVKRNLWLKKYDRYQK